MQYLNLLTRARDRHMAVGAFNIFNPLSISAAIAAANETRQGIILQTSVKTVSYYGASTLNTLVRTLAESSAVPVFLHLDHCRDVDFAKMCIDAGWDSVMYDGSALPLEENIANTRTIALYAHKKDVAVEGELGKIGGIEEEIAVSEEEAQATDLEDSLRFVRESRIDVFAPAIGTAHGVYKGIPKINYSLVDQLSQKLPHPIVVHGGTGLSPETFRKLIRLGCCKINVSTALKNAYYSGIECYLSQENPDREPLSIDRFLQKSVDDMVRYHIHIFSGRQG